MVLLDRKYSEVSKTVKIMSVSITELIWQVKTRGKSIQEVRFFLCELFSIECLMTMLCVSAQIAVPMASTRCQQSLDMLSGLYFEKRRVKRPFGQKTGEECRAALRT